MVGNGEHQSFGLSLREGIVNLMVIAELFLLDSKGKWGMNPNSAQRNRHEKV
jgi:hypothetical protein